MIEKFEDFINEKSGDWSTDEHAITGRISKDLKKIISSETGLDLVKINKDFKNEMHGLIEADVIDNGGSEPLKAKLTITVKIEY